MTYGTAKAFKSGSGICIFISKDAVTEEKIEPGHTVEYAVRKCNIPKKESRKNYFKPTEETKPDPAVETVEV